MEGIGRAAHVHLFCLLPVLDMDGMNLSHYHTGHSQTFLSSPISQTHLNMHDRVEGLSCNTQEIS